MEADKLVELFSKVKYAAGAIGGEGVDKIKTMGRVMQSLAPSSHPIVKVPWMATLLIPLALSYFLFPMDVIPDFLPFVGYIDDIIVIGFIWNLLSTFLEKFKRGEKYEARIRALEQENKELQESLQRAKDEKLCCICMEDPISQLLQPCKHACVCSECAPLLRTCPICRQEIKSKKQIYL